MKRGLITIPIAIALVLPAAQSRQAAPPAAGASASQQKVGALKQTLINAQSKQIQITTTNSNYTPVGQ
jgi:hypothetical protein